MVLTTDYQISGGSNVMSGGMIAIIVAVVAAVALKALFWLWFIRWLRSNLRKPRAGRWSEPESQK